MSEDSKMQNKTKAKKEMPRGREKDLIVVLSITGNP